MKLLKELLNNDYFKDHIVILIIGAILTGILVPYINHEFSKNETKTQILLQNSLSKQEKIIMAQTDFVDIIAKESWNYQLLALEVSFDKIERNEEAFKEAFLKYDEQSWEQLRNIRTAIGSSRWFCNDSTYNNLLSYYYKWLLEIDIQLSYCIRGKRGWNDFHYWLFINSSNKTDSLILSLSHDFGIMKVGE